MVSAQWHQGKGVGMTADVLKRLAPFYGCLPNDGALPVHPAPHVLRAACLRRWVRSLAGLMDEVEALHAAGALGEGSQPPQQ